MENSNRYSASAEVIAREVDGETVLLDLQSGQYFGLDLVGGRVWAMLAEKPHTLGALSEGIEQEFDAERHRIESDLKVLLASLEEQGLITRSPA
jgi:hypothetical protein